MKQNLSNLIIITHKYILFKPNVHENSELNVIDLCVIRLLNSLSISHPRPSQIISPHLLLFLRPISETSTRIRFLLFVGGVPSCGARPSSRDLHRLEFALRCPIRAGRSRQPHLLVAPCWLPILHLHLPEIWRLLLKPRRDAYVTPNINTSSRLPDADEDPDRFSRAGLVQPVQLIAPTASRTFPRSRSPPACQRDLPVSSTT